MLTKRVHVYEARLEQLRALRSKSCRPTYSITWAAWTMP